jgi:NitT/TauT family transport system ATP-binding protein
MNKIVPNVGTSPVQSRPNSASDASLALKLSHVSKVFNRSGQSTVALKNIDLEVRDREFVCLVGASGCGKSTLLNILAGLELPTSGHIERYQSRPALLFQEAALFPWLNVVDNVSFALKVRGVTKKDRSDRACELLKLVRLEQFAHHRPHELSGGMRQRVALARALAQEANLLLMDEPFAALDALMRDHLHEEIDRLRAETKVTILFVTHNAREAVRLADRVLLLSSHPGQIVAHYDINLPHPRRIESSDVAQHARTILDRLKVESAHVIP